MKLSWLTLLLLVVQITGCASSSDLEKVASRQVKAGEYYESIGQPNVAQREYDRAEKNRKAANDLFPMLVALFNLFSSEQKHDSQ